MMRVLRTTLWSGMGEPEIITVMRDSDLADTIESAILQLLDVSTGTLLTYDIFDMPDGDSLAATIEAGKRTHETLEQEMNQSVLYFYVVGTWKHLVPGGTSFSNQPAPLSVEQVKMVLEQLAKHPQYKDYTYFTAAQDGTHITLAHGEVEVT